MKKLLILPLIIIVLGGIIGNALRYTERKPESVADFSKIPLMLNERYSGREYILDDATTEVLKASVSTSRSYMSPNGIIFQLFIAYFESQKYGSQIHSPKHCLPGGGWKIETIEPYQLSLSDGTGKIINRAIIRNEYKQIVMMYWYETRSGSIRGEYGLKLDLIKNSLFMRPTDAAIIRVTIDAGNDIEAATQYGQEFLNQFYPYIRASLPF